jgi:hypothetical protein
MYIYIYVCVCVCQLRYHVHTKRRYVININKHKLLIYYAVFLLSRQFISCYGKLSYVTNRQMQCTLCSCLIIYQFSSKICVFINDKTCGSCTVPYLILYSALSKGIRGQRTDQNPLLRVFNISYFCMVFISDNTPLI